MSFAQMIKDAKKPFEDGFPFGSYIIEHKQLEIKKEKNSKGQYQDYWTWHLQVIKRRHESAQASEGSILKLRRDFSSDFGIGDNTAIAAALCGKTFEDFQTIAGADIDAYIVNLQDEKASAEKHRQFVLEVKPDAKGYRRFHAFPMVGAPEVPFIFDPKMVVARERAETPETAEQVASKGTASKPPTSGL